MRPEIKDICFPVTKVESSSIMKNSNMEFNSENSYAILADLGNGREKALNFCSDQYNLLTNESILSPLIPLLEEKFKGLDVRVSAPHHSQFFVNVAPHVPTRSPKVEVIKPAINFTNSYDGHLKARATGGLVRHLVDEKGRVTKTFTGYLQGHSFMYEFKHSNEMIYSMQEISKQVDQYLADFKKVTDLINIMKHVDFEKATSAKIEKLVYRLIKGTRFPITSITGYTDKTNERIISLNVMSVVERVKYEMAIFECKMNLWILYNSMNYVLETCESEMSEKARMEADNRIFANICELIPQDEE
jgi:hypothetical protein